MPLCNEDPLRRAAPHSPAGGTLSVVIPVYKNGGHLRQLSSEILEAAASIPEISAVEIIFVDDGSPDDSWETIGKLARQDGRIRGFRLSRNFGQHAAITAGLDHCVGDWVLVMDADGQDDPEFIPRLWNKAREGYNVVNARRKGRKDPAARILASGLYHRIFQLLSGLDYDRDVSNFRLIGRKVVLALGEMRESLRGFPLQVHWLGFSTASVDVVPRARWSGTSSYSVKKLLGLGLDVAVAYSNRAIKISVIAGIVIACTSMAGMVYFACQAVVFKHPVPGWASLIVSIWFFSGLILAQLGILGLYISRILTECQRRPIYAVEKSAQAGSPTPSIDTSALSDP